MKKIIVNILCICVFIISCKDNDSAEKLYLSAVESYTEHDLNTAYVFIKQAENLDSSFYQAKFLEAKILFMQEKIEDSAKICKSLSHKYPEYTESRLFLIRCYIFLDRLVEA